MSDGDMIVDVFKRFDSNGDGNLSKQEIRTLLERLDPDTFSGDTLDSLLSAMDLNTDGKVQYAEFVHWITGMETEEVTAFWNAVSPGKNLPKGVEARLDAIIKMSPHLSENGTYKEAREALEAGDESGAFMRSDCLLLQLEGDANRIDAAFTRFNYSGTGELNTGEVNAMFEYLGFPNPDEDEDMKKYVESLDKDSNGKLEKEEFKHFVEAFGGCDALFSRRRTLAARDRTSSSSSLPEGTEFTKEDMRAHMQQAGFEPDSIACWEMILPESELVNVCLLTRCQKRAVSNIRRIAKVNHQMSLPRLQQRVNRLGFKDMDLWTTLSWVRDFAPIIVHFWFDRMCKFLLEDTHYRSQFETGSSCGLNNRKVREKWERDLFQGAYDGCRDFERPKYGVLNVHNDYRGVVRAAQYGDCYMVLKDTRLRTTFSPEDSANLKAERLACLDYYAHVLNEYTDDELKETLKVATTGKLGSSESIVAKGLKYKEAQYHGEICFERHVERIVIPKIGKYTGRVDEIEAVCAKNGWEWRWMEDEREARLKMEEESQDDDKVAAWKAKLKAMSEEGAPDGVDIPEGYCIKGCGREVAPGLTRSGNPYKTCCRGCALGFGHDFHCGRKEGERPPCKMGCGMLAAPGKSRSGRPLDTCCRGCAKGGDHDVRCKQDPA